MSVKSDKILELSKEDALVRHHIQVLGAGGYESMVEMYENLVLDLVAAKDELIRSRIEALATNTQVSVVRMN